MGALDYYAGAAVQEHISNDILASKMQRAADQREALIAERDRAMAIAGASVDNAKKLADKSRAQQEMLRLSQEKIDKLSAENKRLVESLEMRERERNSAKSNFKYVLNSLRMTAKALADAYVAHEGVIDEIQQEVSDFKEKALEMIASKTEVTYLGLRDQIEDYMGTQLRFSQEPALRREYIDAVLKRTVGLLDDSTMRVVDQESLDELTETIVSKLNPAVTAIQREEAMRLRRRHNDMIEAGRKKSLEVRSGSENANDT